MVRKSSHTRRTFIKAAVVGVAAFAVVLWDKMIGRHQDIVGRKTISVPFNANREVSFFDDFIIVNTNEKLKVFSSRCTHLGCKINKHSNNKLLCPCHGSAYNLSGEVITGPAIRSLDELEYEFSDNNRMININT